MQNAASYARFAANSVWIAHNKFPELYGCDSRKKEELRRLLQVGGDGEHVGSDDNGTISLVGDYMADGNSTAVVEIADLGD